MCLDRGKIYTGMVAIVLEASLFSAVLTLARRGGFIYVMNTRNRVRWVAAAMSDGQEN